MNVVRHAGECTRSDAGFGHQFHTICCLGDGQLQWWLFRQALRLWKRGKEELLLRWPFIALSAWQHVSTRRSVTVEIQEAVSLFQQTTALDDY